MERLSILYIGCKFGTSLHRARAFERLGHSVFVVDPYDLVPRHRLAQYVMSHAGGKFFESRVRTRLWAGLPPYDFNLVWVDAGALVSSTLVRELKSRYGLVANYNHDDPYGKRDGLKYALYREAAADYDLVVVVRDCNVEEAHALGAKNVVRVYMSADEVAHAPRAVTAADRKRWGSDVVFAGTWMPERGPFMAKLVDRGIALAIYGDRWHKAKEWPKLERYWRGPGVYDGDHYAKIIQCAKVSLGLLSKGNRDLSTTRSAEIPLLGGLLCAERTVEHKSLYTEGEEALFWSDAEECAAHCKRVLADEELRSKIARKGRERCLNNQTTHEPVLRALLDRLLSVKANYAISTCAAG